ncbi:MAG: response regulator transcription factor [Bacteroidales bacterium]|nr:response regulator transcription factor [Bacteroidales bacterium]
MSKNIDIVIVDDDPLCIDRLMSSLAEFSGVRIAGTARNAELGEELVLTLKPDLLFLDVEMPGESGIDLLRNLNPSVCWPMQVVFYTAYDKYLLDALRQSAFDYMLKPFEPEELRQVMARFFNLRDRAMPSIRFCDELDKTFPARNTLMVTTVDGYRMLQLAQVVYFHYQNDRKRWVLLLSDLTEIYLKRNTSARDILLYSDSFMQINRDQIINVSYLSMIKGKDCILYPPFDRVKGLTASSSFIGQLQERFSMM